MPASHIYSELFAHSAVGYYPCENELQIIAELESFAPGIWAGTEGVIIDCDYGKCIILTVDYENGSLLLQLY